MKKDARRDGLASLLSRWDVAIQRLAGETGIMPELLLEDAALANGTKYPVHYRSKAGSTMRARLRFGHVAKLGKLLSVKGFRFNSTSSGFRSSKERVQVRGEKGTATYDGLCWSYGGEGPRGLVELLSGHCGLSTTMAEMVAFSGSRGDRPGTDWEIDLTTREFKGGVLLHRLA